MEWADILIAPHRINAARGDIAPEDRLFDGAGSKTKCNIFRRKMLHGKNIQAVEY